MYEGGTYAPARGVARRLLAPLRGLAERDRLRFVSHLEPGSRVLEVGAGDGKLVAAMRAAGLDARGIDPSPAACAAARSIGVEVANVGIDEAELPAASEDAVVVWHALEHLDRPGEALARIRGWLRPGGSLVVAVPNLASLQARIGGDRWFHQDVPRHRVHLTPAGVDRAARAQRLSGRAGAPRAGRAESARDVADAAQPPDARARLRLPGAQARPRARARAARGCATGP